MGTKVLGISGSPVANSNTDRAIKAVLEASGLEHEFVKLSELHIRPCKACKSCVKDNVWKQEDDFNWLSKKVWDSDALVIGAYSPYSSLDAFTKAFLERLWSLRHVNNFLRGKPVVTIISGVYPRFLDNVVLRALGLAKLLRWLFLPVNKVSRALSNELRLDRMEILGEVKIRGNVPCLTCGRGDDYDMSSVKFLHGKNAQATADKCFRVEDQEKIWREMQCLGKALRDRLLANAIIRRKRDEAFDVVLFKFLGQRWESFRPAVLRMYRCALLLLPRCPRRGVLL
jgi:hypothetical protein